MSEIVVHKKLVNFQADRSVAEEAKEVLGEYNLTMTQALNLFLKNVVVTKKVDLLSEEELEREQLFKQLQAEVKQSMDEMEAGNCYTEEQLRDYLGI